MAGGFWDGILSSLSVVRPGGQEGDTARFAGLGRWWLVMTTSLAPESLAPRVS